MGEVIQFPKLIDGVPVDTSKQRIKALEQRLGELERRISHYQEDMDYIHQCMVEDSHEMGQVIGELAHIHGFDETQEHITNELQRWLEKERGDDHDKSR
jgi:uncharacterized coiled-coil protein SlyX|tara:strand:+ start:92 stop:388 length:297 start_codon:yes stop_codon:yes gene_type:complete